LIAVFEEVPESEGGGYVAYTEELPGAVCGFIACKKRGTTCGTRLSCSRKQIVN